MNNCKEAATPILTTCYLNDDEKGAVVDQTKFRGLIGSLLYLMTNRPDIMFNVCMYAKFQANPKESHYNATKRILKSLKGTVNVGVWYRNGTELNFLGFSGPDFAGCKLDRKSTS